MTMELFLKKAIITYVKKNTGEDLDTDSIMTYLSVKAHGNAKGIFSFTDKNDTQSFYIVSYFNKHGGEFFIKRYDFSSLNPDPLGTKIDEDEVIN